MAVLGAHSSRSLLVDELLEVPLNLRARGGDADIFGATISLNDFYPGKGVGGSGAVGIDLDPGSSFPLDSELSGDDLKGNYLGRTCDDSDSEGFRDTDEPDRRQKTDSPNMIVTDSHPYGQPFANVLNPPSPAICK